MATWVIRTLTQREADAYLESMSCGRVDHWLRLEHLADDFLAALARYVEITPEAERAVRALPPRNVGSAGAPEAWFKPEDLRRSTRETRAGPPWSWNSTETSWRPDPQSRR